MRARTSVAVDQDMIAELKIQVLHEHMEKICDVVDPSRVVPYLISSQTINMADKQDLQAQPQKYLCAQHLVEIIEQRGSRAFDAFCGALNSVSIYRFLLESINQTLEKKRLELEGTASQTSSPPPKCVQPPPAPTASPYPVVLDGFHADTEEDV